MNWLVKRVGRSALTVIAVVTLAFALIRLMPGGPVDYIRAQFMSGGGGQSMAQINAMVESYINVDPSKPLWRQYINYVIAVLQGDFGESFWYDQPVSSILAEAIPWTVFIMTISLVIGYIISIVLGAMMAYHEGSRLDTVGSVLSVVLNSTPFYIVAILLVLLFAQSLELFPTSGKADPTLAPGMNVPWILSVLYHAALPVLSIVITSIGGRALAMRGNSIQILGEDYLRVARLRGLSPNLIATRYVARNAVLPLYTGLLISIGNVFGGAIILEVIFNYRGVGFYIYKAVQARDYPLLMGGFILITVAVVIALLIADLTYGKLDPRAKGGETGEAY